MFIKKPFVLSSQIVKPKGVYSVWYYSIRRVGLKDSASVQTVLLLLRIFFFWRFTTLYSLLKLALMYREYIFFLKVAHREKPILNRPRKIKTTLSNRRSGSCLWPVVSTVISLYHGAGLG